MLAAAVAVLVQQGTPLASVSSESLRSALDAGARGALLSYAHAGPLTLMLKTADALRAQAAGQGR